MSESAGQFEKAHARALERLWGRAAKACPALHQSEEFVAAVERSVARRFGPQTRARTAEVERYLESLHAEDLALACACRAGSPESRQAAWEEFLARYRPVLYAAARAIVGRSGESAARELADSVWAELFSLEVRSPSGAGRSLLDYYHGRSSLATWLRAVLAQRWVDRVRAGRRTESLEEARFAADAGAEREQATPGSPPATGAAPTGRGAATTLPDPDAARLGGLMEAALAQAIAALAPRERLLLSLYYVQGLTLAKIGRLLGEHEATASRKLERARRGLREEVERTLRETRRLSDAQIALAYESALEGGAFDLAKTLSAEGAELRDSRVQENRIGTFQD